MKLDLALRLLGEQLGLEGRAAEIEFKRLEVLSDYKYDRYSEFVAGFRFLESLGRWLQQFETLDERKTAYEFVRRRLIFVTTAELERLVEAFFPRFMYYDVLHFVADRYGTPLYRALELDEQRKFFGDEVRRSLIIGVSDGARTDLLRRLNVGRISNNQVLLSPDPDPERLIELKLELENEQGTGAQFTRVYLLDDFTASGHTFFRRKAEGIYAGKLFRFYKRFNEQASEHCDAIREDALIRLHHFLGTAKARDVLAETLELAKLELGASGSWFPGEVKMTFGHILGQNIPIVTPEMTPTFAADEPFIRLCKKYYDPAIEKSEHDQVDLWFGFKYCGLPLVLQHNTPNNSLALLWKESEGSKGGPAMYSLFRRRERH